MTRPIRLLVNPAASGGRSVQALQPVLLELERLGIEHAVADTTSADHAREIAAEAAAAGETVAACGGDGMVGLVAGAVNGTAGALAVIPTGRGNDFARVLDIPTDPAEAARIAATGEEKMLDIGFCDDKPFVGIASCGFDSDANRIANETKVVKGNLVYLYAALKALWQWKPATFTVTIDGERHVVTGYSVVVGNSKVYGGGMYILPMAELDDGKLDILLSAQTPKRRFLAYIPKVFKGAHTDDPSTTFLRGERVEVSADRPFAMYADGDPIADLPATVTVQTRSLRVLVPSSA